MIAQFILTALLGGLLLYAVREASRSPVIGVSAVMAAIGGMYVVWVPSHASRLAEWAGIGRGADLILYVWVAISLIILLNLHLKMRRQLELITGLSRAMALLNASFARTARTTSRRDTSSPRDLGSEPLQSAVKPHRPFKRNRDSAARAHTKKAS
jgi:hypothetical protein